MVKDLIYGKIIIDTLRLADGQIHNNMLGGGGPQALFGARLWHDSVGFLSRSGTDIDPQFIAALKKLGVDSDGWVQYPDLTTLRGGVIAYDEDEYAVDPEQSKAASFRKNWLTMMGRPLSLPPHYQQPRTIHLMTEYFSEPMVNTALELQKQGAVFSLEPIIDFSWDNRDELLALLPQVDIVSPDWPTASGLADSDDPKTVLAHWSTLGASIVAVRHGRNGSYVWDRFTNESWHIPVVPVNAIDPTGGGNSYGSGFFVGWSETNSALAAGCYGTVSASFVVESVGMPSEVTAQMRTAAAERVKQLMGRAKRL